MKTSEPKFAVILLAAGKATRFEGNKLLSKINNKRIIDYSLNSFKELEKYMDPIIVVIGAYKKEMEKNIQNIDLVYNPDYETGGMISSIQAGINKLEKSYKNIKGIFIHPADIPFIKPQDLIKMIEMLLEENYDIVLPYYNKRRGHPVLIKSKLSSELLNLDDKSQGLRGFINAHNKKIGLVNTENSGVIRDIDYKSDISNNG